MIPINLSSFTANSSSPKYDPSFPLGDRGTSTGGILVGEADFEIHGTTPPVTTAGTAWAIGSNPDGQTTIMPDGWLRQFWPANTSGLTNAINFWWPPGTRKFGMSFWIKMEGGIALKFCKHFGIQHPPQDGVGYANSTFQMSGGGTMFSVSYGDGSGGNIDNDAGNVVLFDGSNHDFAGRSFGLPGFEILAPMSGVNGGTFNFADGQPHFMEIEYAQNTGTSSQNEINDGEIFVRIDGNVHMKAKGLYNKYPLNDFIDYSSLGNYAQGNSIDSYVYFKNPKYYLGGLPA